MSGIKEKEYRCMKIRCRDNKLMQSLIEVSKELKIHNLVEQIKDIRKNYYGYFTKIKNGDSEAKPPKPNKISKIKNATIFTDGYKSFSYKPPKKKDKGKKIGINLDSKMKYIYLPHKYIEKVTGSMANILNVNINYSNGNFYFLINYEKEKAIPEESSVMKWAGIDPGVYNLLSIYIDSVFNTTIENLVKDDAETIKETVIKEDTAQMKSLIKKYAVSLAVYMAALFLCMSIFGRIGFAYSLPVYLVAIYYAFKLEFLFRKKDILTYKEVVAYLEGKELTESEKRAEKFKRKIQYILLMIITLFFTLGVVKIALFISEG